MPQHNTQNLQNANNVNLKIEQSCRWKQTRTIAPPILPLCALNYYRAMHFSAKRGIAIACRLSVRPSVRPSVCDVGEL